MVAYVAVRRPAAYGDHGADHRSQHSATVEPPEGEADDSAPAWSPNGREIAFLRVVSARDCTVMLLPSNGGAERRVGSCDPRNPPTFDWTLDGRGLVFGSRGTPVGGAGLRVLDLASGAWALLDYDGDAAGRGFRARAIRLTGAGSCSCATRRSGDLWRIPATGGTAQRLTRLHADIRGWDWTPDGRGIVLRAGAAAKAGCSAGPGQWRTAGPGRRRRRRADDRGQSFGAGVLASAQLFRHASGRAATGRIRWNDCFRPPAATVCP